jgi:hypothetical protein
VGNPHLFADEIFELGKDRRGGTILDAQMRGYLDLQNY